MDPVNWQESNWPGNEAHSACWEWGLQCMQGMMLAVHAGNDARSACWEWGSPCVHSIKDLGIPKQHHKVWKSAVAGRSPVIHPHLATETYNVSWAWTHIRVHEKYSKFCQILTLARTLWMSDKFQASKIFHSFFFFLNAVHTVQAGLELHGILLPPPHKFMDYFTSPHTWNPLCFTAKKLN